MEEYWEYIKWFGKSIYKEELELLGNEDVTCIFHDEFDCKILKNDIDKELERYMYVIAPKCYPENGSPLITHQDLVYNAGMNKDKLLDIDEKSYCKVYVKTKCVEYGKWEWNTMISCKNYKDKGFVDWDKGFEPKK